MPKKRHHYIPEFYLKGFIDSKNEPNIWVYDKDDGKVIKATARNIAVEKHYFSFINESGERDSETIENLMAGIESETAKVLNKIKSCTDLTGDDKLIFTGFIACMMIRVPNFRQNTENAVSEMMKKMNIIWASHRKGFEASVKKMEEETRKEIGIPIEELRQFALKGEYDIKISPQFSLALILGQFESLHEIFFNMRWAFLKATEEYKFLSGDNPLFYNDPTHDPTSFYGVGLANKNIEVTFPVSKDIAAYGSWKGPEGYIQAKNNTVRTINRRTVSAALKFVFSSEKSDTLKRFVTKYKGSSPKLLIS
ncbi:MAG: DUF4238 domain-containing protein [Nitrospirota bacterium]